VLPDAAATGPPIDRLGIREATDDLSEHRSPASKEVTWPCPADNTFAASTWGRYSPRVLTTP
jgi:hypothetical protein